jgi:coenzyme F420-reducing hydrogenase delta subunit
LTEETNIAAQVKNWVPVICSGKIDTPEIIEGFHKGADGVLILACPEGDCHYQDGNCETRKKVYLLQSILETQGIERQRLKLILGHDPEGQTIPEIVGEMSKELITLGPRFPAERPNVIAEGRL